MTNLGRARRHASPGAAPSAVPSVGRSVVPTDVRGALVADVRVRRGDFALAAALTVEPGRVNAVLGPNGAGKSTLLALLAGTLAAESGHVRVGDRVLTRARAGRTGASGGTSVAAEAERRTEPVAPVGRGEPVVQVPVARRAVVLLGQDPLVFPHLDVLENVAFGPRAAGMRAGPAHDEARAWIEAVGLGTLQRRRPDELSGGQRQRVALARALAARPDALLLDEPFAQLDVRTAAELREVVREHVRATRLPTVLVTHDVVDVLALADHVVVLHDGQVVEQGDPVTVLTDPLHPFTAALADLNLLRATWTAPDAATPARHLRTAALDLTLTAGTPAQWVEKAPPGVTFSTHSDVQLTFSPGDVRIVGGGAAGSAGDEGGGAGGLVWSAAVVDVERGPRGLRVRTTDDVLVDVAAASAVALDLRPGAALTLRVDAADVRVRSV